MPDPAYQRLTRDRLTQRFAIAAAAKASLWLGTDHLLLVQQSGYTETYKRFYFRDIQAVTVLETNRRTIWNAILGTLLGICLLGLAQSAAAPRNIAAMIVWSIIGLVFLLPFVINNVRGTACTCRLRTAVQTEDLASLSRVRQTQKVLGRIRPLIVAAQGQLSSEEVSTRMRAIASDGMAPPDQRPPPAAPPVLS